MNDKKFTARKTKSLTLNVLIQMCIRLTLVMLAVTGLSYWHIIETLETENHDKLLKYISERGGKESAVFQLAEANHQIFKKEFLKNWESRERFGDDDYFRLYEKLDDGTTRLKPKYYDGYINKSGLFSHSITSYVGANAPVDDPDYRKRLVIITYLVERFGPAWFDEHSLGNFYAHTPENHNTVYWPGTEWALQAESDLDITKEEWTYIATQASNPHRESVWTGLYYDPTARQWMVSLETPIDKDGQHLVNAGHDILLGEIFDRVFNDHLTGAYNFIVRDDGRLVAHPDRVDEINSSKGMLYIDDLNDSLLSSVYQQIKDYSGDEESFVIDDEANDAFIAVTRVVGPDWRFVTFYPKELLASVARSVAEFILGLSAIALLLELFMLYLVMSSKIVKPINTLHEASILLSEGSYDDVASGKLALPVERKDEIGLLARVYQLMSINIRDYQINLEDKVVNRTRDLERSKVEAEKAVAVKSEFLAKMSHEIRTPMNSVIGLSRLGLKNELSSELKDYFEKILGSGETLLGIINDILDFSKIEANKMSLENVSFNLEKVIDRTITVCSLKAHEKSLELILDIDENVPTYIKGDPLRLQQILVNLTNNAIKFTEHGHVLIKFSVDLRRSDQLTLRCEVTDTGIGMSKEQHKKLFESFSQVDNSTTRKYGGTGLGLAICKQLIELMDGRIWVESEENKGSNFIFTLPAKSVLAPEFNLRPPVDLKNLKALVVDDSDVARNILSEMLGRTGIQVDQAHDGEQAVTMVEQENRNGQEYDLILMDWRMPGMDGITAAKKIKQLGCDRTPKLLLVSSSSYDMDDARSMSVGIDGFVVKPLNSSILFDAVVDCLETDTPALQTSSEGKQTADSTLIDLSGAHVLLVDDNAINRQVAIGFLQSTGVHIDIAVDGVDAVEKATSHAYDLIFMDVQMPRMDGFMATSKIRENSDLASLPIVAMTAHAMEGDREKSLNAGMNDHLTKPINPDELYRAMTRWIKLDDVNSTSQAMLEIQPGNGSDYEDNVEIEHVIRKLESTKVLDVSGALGRMQGNKRLYQRVLLDFAKDHAGFDAKLRSFSDNGEHDELYRAIHSLRSKAAYIGAVELSELCVEMEKSLGNGDSSELFLEQVCDLSSELHSHLHVLKLLGDLTEADECEFCLDKLIDQLLQLQPLLRTSDFSAGSLLKKIQMMVSGTGYQSHIENLIEYVDEVEFEDAVIYSEKILAKLVDDAQAIEQV